MRIRDVDPRSRIKKTPYPGAATKKLSILTQINVTKPLEYDPRCFLRIQDPDFSISDPRWGQKALAVSLFFPINSIKLLKKFFLHR